MLIVALISTVALLICMGFFMMSSLPLLILKHDTPLDARFIRTLFNVYYVALMGIAAVGSLSYGLLGKVAIALALAGIVLLGFTLRRGVIGRMDRVRTTMTADDVPGIRRFRQLHVTGMVLNAVLLLSFCVGMTRMSFQT